MPDCLTPSDQVTLHGAVPVSAAWIVAAAPAQISAEPEAVAVGFGLTVTTALPEAVPVQFASEIDVTVYVVVPAGETERDAGEAATPDCVTPSDQTTVQGPAPVSAAWIVVADPVQIAAVPETAAVGFGATVIVTEGA